jgi:hypothetical protein
MEAIVPPMRSTRTMLYTISTHLGVWRGWVYHLLESERPRRPCEPTIDLVFVEAIIGRSKSHPNKLRPKN